MDPSAHVPGLAKTLPVKSMAAAIGGQFNRIQFRRRPTPTPWSARSRTRPPPEEPPSGRPLLASIDGIAAIDPAVAPTGVDLGTAAAPAYAADVIVLLTDGANTQGVEPEDAAKLAAARGLRIFTIGFGTTTPTRMACTGAQVEGSYGGGGGGYGARGGGNPLIIDEAALQHVAKTTGGQYYRAENADQLQSALGDLPSHVTVVHRTVDLAAWFAGGGGLLVVLAVGLSLWWNRVRVPRTAGTAGSIAPTV